MNGPMLTLDQMRRFVVTATTETNCPGCSYPRPRGLIRFNAVLVIYPEFDSDETMDMQAHVGVDVMLDSQTCPCKITIEELHHAREEAHVKMLELFNEFRQKEHEKDFKRLPPVGLAEDLGSYESLAEVSG